MNNGIDYLNSLGLHRVKPGLERIKSILKDLGDPQDKIPGIIITGTNGKGSVAATISSILKAQGYKTGLYTSPHFINITERIKINGVQISESELSEIILQIKETAEKAGIEQLSYFEVISAAGFVYFAREKAEFNVLEVGMGGRWDATNIINPLLSIITNVSLEHTEYLGSTIEQIAGEKACIIKSGVPVVTGANDEAIEVIKKVSEETKSKTFIIDKDFRITENQDKLVYEGISMQLVNISSNLKGKFQVNNIAIAIAAIEILNNVHEIKISEQSIREGLFGIDWGGRFETLRESPPLIIDSAHNPGAGKALAESIESAYPDTKFTVLIGMLEDKGHAEFLKAISGITEFLIITKVPSERTADTNKLFSIAQQYIQKIEVIEDYQKAFEFVERLENTACIAGSIYLVGAIKELINRRYDS